MSDLVRPGEGSPSEGGGLRYVGVCTLCRLRVFTDAAGNEVRRQGGGRPPETPHRHKKPYSVHMPVQERDDTFDHGWRGWMDTADRMGAL